ncbi:MAG TPA: carotenoid biosynthesis protein [Pedobacter sp.]|jgi:putative membrane protein
MKISSTGICASLVVLFFTVGFIGFTSPEYSNQFKQLVPFHLLLMFGLMLISHEDKNKAFWTFLLVAFFAGFLIEFIGVTTGLIFGNYRYGATLGPKLADIPILIGVNWILVIYSTGIFLKIFGIKSHTTRALIGAFIITVLDFFIEPVAIKYDYWSWAGREVPFHNYIGWFLFSYALLRLFFHLKFRKNNFAAIVLFIVQFVFFFVLNMKVL